MYSGKSQKAKTKANADKEKKEMIPVYSYSFTGGHYRVTLNRQLVGYR